MPAAGFEVLLVCSGNLCRSPLAAQVLRSHLGPGSAVVVTSAGTHAMVGSVVPPRLVRLAGRRGADLREVVPRQLTREHLAGADLVLTATRAQRATVVGAHPGALRRTFTLRELARLVAVPAPAPRAPGGTGALGAREPGRGAREDLGEVERWAALAGTAAARRSLAPARPEEDDVVDPYRRSQRTCRAALDQVEAAVAALLAAVGHQRGDGGRGDGGQVIVLPVRHSAVSMARSSVEDVPGV